MKRRLLIVLVLFLGGYERLSPTKTKSLRSSGAGYALINQANEWVSKKPSDCNCFALEGWVFPLLDGGIKCIHINMDYFSLDVHGGIGKYGNRVFEIPLRCTEPVEVCEGMSEVSRKRDFATLRRGDLGA